MTRPAAGGKSRARNRHSPAMRGRDMASGESQVQSLAAEQQPGGNQQDGRIHGSIEGRQRAGAPRNQALLEEHQLPNVIPLQMRNQKIERVNDGSQRLGLPKSYLVEMPSD